MQLLAFVHTDQLLALGLPLTPKEDFAILLSLTMGKALPDPQG